MDVETSPSSAAKAQVLPDDFAHVCGVEPRPHEHVVERFVRGKSRADGRHLAIDIGDFLQEDTEPGMQYRA